MDDTVAMTHAHALSLTSRRVAPPNPWVGAVVVDHDELVGTGATSAPGGPHAEVVALNEAGERARGATLVTTLEPCAHRGRTGPCTDAIIAAGIRRVVVGVRDPDHHVAGRGVAALRDSGIDVREGVLADEITASLAPYLWHRATGRPYVVLKVAATLDGRVAMGDDTSQWITSAAARADGHELRADSQAIVVGAGTVRADNPRLTARTADATTEPLRVVLGTAAPAARVHPCLERVGDLEVILKELAERGVLQVLVEGGPRTSSSFVEQGFVNRVVWYAAPALAGAAAGRGAFSELATGSMSHLRRGRVVDVRRVGEDVRIEMEL